MSPYSQFHMTFFNGIAYLIPMVITAQQFNLHMNTWFLDSELLTFLPSYCIILLSSNNNPLCLMLYAYNYCNYATIHINYILMTAIT